MLLLWSSPCSAGAQSKVRLSQSMQRQDYQTGAVQPRQRENLRREGRREGEDEVRRGGRGGWMYERGRARIEVRRRGGGN